ncbi:hypothetical protein [Paenisporosarcina sp. NPDC076898]|uniref:hypothetical protein n=1 Tax=unclassified Paenisporosarcina TaxID=2642018 RepID=UPI003CFE7C26
MNKPYLYKYEETKWDWTKSAASLFMNGFKRFDQKIDDKEQVYVGVYGPTQVGKTTFILRLLGIGFSHLNKLSDSLRGGREKGKSATITCTIFQRSTTADFEVIWPSGEIHLAKTFNDLEKVMGDLRVSIYKNKSFSLKPVIVKIPKKYFNRADIDSRVRDLSIIDLPGDDSKDSQEMLHVNRVLKEYIARCKVCIIMEISSQMTALTKLEKELVKDWLVLPEQFRILLTRSVSNSSVMEQIVAKQIISAEQFKQIYHDELARVCEEHELATAIYPLEFGDSWVDLKQAYPKIFNLASRWVDEIFEELVKDLTNINSPEQEIKKLKSIERFIVKESQDELNRLQHEIEIMNLEKQEFQLNINHMKQLLEKEERKLTRLKDVQKDWSRFNVPAFPSVNFNSWSNLTVGTKKASHLKSQFRGNVRELEDFAKEQVELLNIKIRGDCRLISINLPEMDFPEEIFRTNLHFDYLIDRYLLESSYSSDVSHAKRKLAEVIDRFEEELNRHVKKCCDLLKEPFRNQKAAIKLEKEELKQMNKQLNAKNNKLQALLDEKLKAKEEWKSDIARANQLDFFLMESFVDQSNEYKRKLDDVNSNLNEKWYAHQYWNVLKMQAERIIDYVE